MMNKLNLTPEAKERLEFAINKYRANILSNIESISESDDKQICIKDIEYAIKCAEKMQKLYNNVIQTSIKSDIFMSAVLSCTACAYLGLLSYLGSGLGPMEKIPIYICLIISIFDIFITVRFIQKRRNIPIQKNKIFEFINKWEKFETLLKDDYTKSNSDDPSFLDLTHNMLEVNDVNYPKKANDFKTVLAFRNRIVYNESMTNISYNEIQKHIDILNKLIHSINGYNKSMILN